MAKRTQFTPKITKGASLPVDTTKEEEVESGVEIVDEEEAQEEGEKALLDIFKEDSEEAPYEGSDPSDDAPIEGQTSMQDTDPEKDPEESKESLSAFINAGETTPAERLVRVKPRVTYNTNIGGTWYYFEQEVCQNVPENVKRIMAEGNMLLPL